MPLKEKYGAQPPLELIRQWFSQKGWFDRKSLEFKKILDIQFAAAMGTGRAQVSERILRRFLSFILLIIIQKLSRFNIVYIHEFDETTLFTIVKKVLEWGLETYVDKIKFLIKSLTNINISIFKSISKEFLPLPRKSHYLFNLRDLFKVIQGILAVPSSKYDSIGDNRRKILRLWVFENNCVYSDRLIDDADKKIFKDMLSRSLIEEYRFNSKNK